MQAILAIPGSPDRSIRHSSGELNEFSGRLSEYVSRKLHLNDFSSIAEEEEKPEHEHKHEHEPEHDDIEDVEDEEEEEFTFACTNPDGSPISADEVFQDGQIRPVFPVFDQSLLFAEGVDGDLSYSRTSTSSLRPPLKKLFVEERHPPSSSSSEAEELDGTPVGPYCEWTRKVVEASPATCKKSNSTGFSKLWRFRDLMLRSNSDGKDAFVFLSSPPRTTKKSEKVAKESDKVVMKKSKGTSTGEKVKVKKTTPSAHELHYVKNRAMREEDKRRSYLPYRQGVVGVGFFTTVNGLTRNVHPY